MKPGRVLIEIKNHILANGWCQHRYNQGKRVCLEEALHVVITNNRVARGTRKHVWGLLQKLAGTPVLFQWNDHPERTIDDVVRLLNKAALVEARRELGNGR